MQSVSDQNTTLKNAPSLVKFNEYQESFIYYFSILSKILTVSESTLIYRKRLRSIYRDDQNEKRTVRQIQHGRMKYVH